MMSQTYDEPHRGTSPATPRWVKIFGIITLVLIVLVSIILLSGGEHGPGRHTSPIEHSTQQP